MSREPGLVDAHVAERVVAVDVLAGGDQQRLGRELPHDRLEDDVEHARVVAVVRARRQRDVHREPLARPSPHSGKKPLPG